MDLAHPSSLLVSTGIVALVGWRVYTRVKRLIGRQRLSAIRPWLTVVIFPILALALLLASWAHPAGALALAGGVTAGVALGFYGLRLTRFERTPEGFFYTPNAHLGIALSSLLLLRIGYRVAQLYFAAGAISEPPTAFVRSPLTLLIFGTLAGYYVAYAIGLLRWRFAASPPA